MKVLWSLMKSFKHLFNENPEISDEKLGSPMKSLWYPRKICEFPMRWVWGSPIVHL